MKTHIVALAAFLAALATSTPATAYAEPGDYAKTSKRFQTYVDICGMRESPRIQDEAAKKLEQMSVKQFELHMEVCPKPRTKAVANPAKDKVADNKVLPFVAGAAVGTVVGAAVVSQRPRYGAPVERPMYRGDRELLELQSLGPRGRVIRNRPAPAGAIPCIVRGVVGKCVPR